MSRRDSSLEKLSAHFQEWKISKGVKLFELNMESLIFMFSFKATKKISGLKIHFSIAKCC